MCRSPPGRESAESSRPVVPRPGHGSFAVPADRPAPHRSTARSCCRSESRGSRSCRHPPGSSPANRGRRCGSAGASRTGKSAPRFRHRQTSGTSGEMTARGRSGRVSARRFRPRCPARDPRDVRFSGVRGAPSAASATRPRRPRQKRSATAAIRGRSMFRESRECGVRADRRSRRRTFRRRSPRRCN